MAVQVQDAFVFSGDLVLALVVTLLSEPAVSGAPQCVALFNESRHGTLESSVAEMA